MAETVKKPAENPAPKNDRVMMYIPIVNANEPAVIHMIILGKSYYIPRGKWEALPYDVAHYVRRKLKAESNEQASVRQLDNENIRLY